MGRLFAEIDGNLSILRHGCLFPFLISRDALNMNEGSVKGGRAGEIPILLLKTKSTPHDGYEEHFLGGEKRGDWIYEPLFVPVLAHKLHEEALLRMKELLERKEISKNVEAKYGGIIFTSQRAVEAFSKLVEEGDDDSKLTHRGWPYLEDIPIYTVGPATSRALRSIPQIPSNNVLGAETGNGESLAHYILEHYGDCYADRPLKPPLLFVVGEQRRDIIPKILKDSTLPDNKQILVEELVVYETGVMETFESQFSRLLQDTEDKKVRWIIVFSPTGCEAMLRELDMLNPETGRVKIGERGGGCGNRKGRGRRTTYIATIGPTTRDYLRKSFGFEPDVCAGKPSPEGLSDAIDTFMDKNYPMDNEQ